MSSIYNQRIDLTTALHVYANLKDQGSSNDLAISTAIKVLIYYDKLLPVKKRKFSKGAKILEDKIIDAISFVLKNHQKIIFDNIGFPPYIPPENQFDLTENQMLNQINDQDKYDHIVNQIYDFYGYVINQTEEFIRSENQRETEIKKQKEIDDRYFMPLEDPEIGISGIVESISPEEIPERYQVEAEFPIEVGQNYDQIYRIRFSIADVYTGIYMFNQYEKMSKIREFADAMYRYRTSNQDIIDLVSVNYEGGLSIVCQDLITLKECQLIRKNRSVIFITKVIPDQQEQEQGQEEEEE